jgi:DNA-binding response OmpR family regulator
MTKRKILLVEDDITLGDLLVYALGKRDYEVTWFCRARLDSAGKLIFINDRGVETDFDASADADTKADGARYALVDSRLKGSVMQGVDVTRALVARGVKVIAISGLSSLNKELIAAGALGGIEKFDIVSRLSAGIEQLTNTSSAEAPKTSR